MKQNNFTATEELNQLASIQNRVNYDMDDC